MTIQEEAQKPQKEQLPLISIVIATFHQHTSLPIAVRSALNQTHGKVEVVAVPVRSDLETVNVLKYFPTVKIVPSDKADYVHQRNLGVDKAQGAWISFLDSDDYYLPSKVRADLLIAEKEKAYVVYAPLLQADQYFRVVDMVKVENFSYEALLKNCFITDSSLFLKSLWTVFHGFDESKGEMAFYDFWLKCAENYPLKIRQNPFPGYVYVQHGAQMHRRWTSEQRAQQRAKVVSDSLARMRRRAEADEAA
jgi:glycosyltransferase involved in cell wall biosynthesis